MYAWHEQGNDYAQSTINNPQDQMSGKQQLTEGNMIKFCLLMINGVWAHL